MDDAIGMIFIVSIAGVIFGDPIGRKTAVWMLIGSLIYAFILSPMYALALVLAPVAFLIICIGGLIAFIKKL